MTDQFPSDSPLSPSGEYSLARMHDQAGWVTSISIALSSTQNVDDIWSLVLSGLLAPTGIAFTRALLFEHDQEAGVLRGRTVVGYGSLKKMAAIGEELIREEKFLEERSRELEDVLREDPMRVENQLHALQNGSQWITLYQRLNPENPQTRAISRLSIPTTGESSGESALFDDVTWWRRSRALCRSELGQQLPAVLNTILPEHFAAIPIITRRKLRALVVADRSLRDNSPVTEQELSELDWFARQSALAIENVELISDLNTTNQELLQLDQLKTNFISTISHELRTPLTAMSGFIELILEGRVGEIPEDPGDLNANQRGLIERVALNNAHLSRLVNDLIELAELQAEGMVEINIERVEPLTVLMSTLPRLEQRRTKRDVAIIPIIDGDIPAIRTDERSLSRILFHLLDNAVKFSFDGGEVSVRFEEKDADLHISIHDDGPGIPKEKRQKIFDQFYQIDNSMTRAHEGLGLGLTVTQMLVQASKGELLVDSVEGCGSTFTLVYPIHGKLRD